MYHIKPDRRSQRSAEAICRAAHDLWASSDSEPSVTEVARAAGVGRATFYRLFDRPTDVLRYEIDLAYWEVEAEMRDFLDDRDEVAEVDAFRRQFAFWVRHRDLLRVTEQLGQLSYFTNCAARAMRSNIGRATAESSLDSRQRDYYTQARAAVFTRLLQVALHRYPGDTPDALARMMTQILGNRTVRLGAPPATPTDRPLC